jgi:hypothetical protein
MVKYIRYTTAPATKHTPERARTLDVLQDMREFMRIFPKYKGMSAEEYTAQTVSNYKDFERCGIVKNIKLLDENGDEIETEFEILTN